MTKKINILRNLEGIGIHTWLRKDKELEYTGKCRRNFGEYNVAKRFSDVQ